MKVLKLQDSFNGSFGGIMFMQLSSGCMWSKHQMSKSVFTTQSIASMENITTKP